MNISENSHLEYQAMLRTLPILSILPIYGNIINITKDIHFEPGDLLVTIDVSFLYTNIPHTEGRTAINKMIEETGTDTLLKMFISNLTY